MHISVWGKFQSKLFSVYKKYWVLTPITVGIILLGLSVLIFIYAIKVGINSIEVRRRIALTAVYSFFIIADILILTISLSVVWYLPALLSRKKKIELENYWDSRHLKSEYLRIDNIYDSAVNQLYHLKIDLDKYYISGYVKRIEDIIEDIKRAIPEKHLNLLNLLINTKFKQSSSLSNTIIKIIMSSLVGYLSKLFLNQSNISKLIDLLNEFVKQFDLAKLGNDIFFVNVISDILLIGYGVGCLIIFSIRFRAYRKRRKALTLFQQLISLVIKNREYK